MSVARTKRRDGAVEPQRTPRGVENFLRSNANCSKPFVLVCCDCSKETRFLAWPRPHPGQSKVASCITRHLYEFRRLTDFMRRSTPAIPMSLMSQRQSICIPTRPCAASARNLQTFACRCEGVWDVSGDDRRSELDRDSTLRSDTRMALA